MITRASLDSGLSAKLIFIVDTADPLRKVYDFLSDDYEKWIGHPLGSIPAPDENGNATESGTYGEYFLGPFLDALKQIGVVPELVDNYQSYVSGKFTPAIKTFIEKKDEVKEIIERVSGRELDDDWFPFNPAGSDGSMDGVIVTGCEWPIISWRDSLGVEGESDLSVTGVFHGKLPWRLDWPAKWFWLGVTCEAFGKDHGASGGSYDTGKELVGLLDYDAPHPLTYEWIQVKGMGPMSSSTGITIGPVETLKLIPPEIMRFVIAKAKVGRHIDFDTGGALFEAADEYERSHSWLISEEFGDDMSKRQRVAMETQLGAMRLSQVERNADASDSIGGVSFKHLSMLAQIKSDDDDIWKSLQLSKHLSGEPSDALKNRLNRMRYWISSEHFPVDAKIRLQSKLSDAAIQNISMESKEYLEKLSEVLSNCNWDVDSIRDCICDLAKERGIGLRNAFVMLYWIFLDQHHGPKMANLLVELESDYVIGMILEAISQIS